MSNETDLDWLARNVPLEQVRGWIQKAGEGFNIVASGIPPAIFGQPAWFSAREVLARRAELQNKPNWALAPEWAEWLAQDDDCVWYWHRNKPNGGEKLWVSYGESEVAQRGELLCDLRDTLEQRPHVEADITDPFDPEFRPVSVSNDTVPLEQPVVVAGTGNGSASEAALLIGRVVDLLRTSADHFSADELAELNELTSAEITKCDATACGGQKYLDAHWFERGELPPVGVECEAFAEGVDPEKCKIIAYHKNQVAVQWFEFNDGCLDVLGRPEWSFRPLRKNEDRDALMAVLACYSGALPKTHHRAEVANAILAAGFKRELK